MHQCLRSRRRLPVYHNVLLMSVNKPIIDLDNLYFVLFACSTKAYEYFKRFFIHVFVSFLISLVSVTKTAHK